MPSLPGVVANGMRMGRYVLPTRRGCQWDEDGQVCPPYQAWLPMG